MWVYELGVAASRNMWGQWEPLGLKYTCTRKPNELRVAENIERQSGVLKLLQHVRVWLLLCVRVRHARGLSHITQTGFWTGGDWSVVGTTEPVFPLYHSPHGEKKKHLVVMEMQIEWNCVCHWWYWYWWHSSFSNWPFQWYFDMTQKIKYRCK